MYYAPIIFDALKSVWWFLPLGLIISLLKTPLIKGWLGELVIRVSGALFLSKNNYFIFHNVTLPTADGTTQIDHIIVSVYGVFVLETKNMKGWIFGSERQAQWTQKVYKKSYQFQNPLHQNYKHVKALEAVLSISVENIHSVVVFVGGCTLKTNMPPNVTYGGGYLRYVKSFYLPVFTEEQVQTIIDQIESARYTPSLAINREHVRHLKAQAEPTANRLCPKCGSAMVLRTAKRGSRAGNTFWGCSSFPKCRQVVNTS